VKTFNSDTEYLAALAADPDFTRLHYVIDGIYVKDGRAYQDFTNSDGKNMRRYFYFGKYNCDGKYKNGPQIRGDFYQLVTGSEFVAE
jgi:hypothetical protein